MVVTDADIQAVYDALPLQRWRANIVVFSGPQLSLFEMQDLAELFEGRQGCAGHVGGRSRPTTWSTAMPSGWDTSTRWRGAGVTILQGVCFYILQRLSKIREENGWTNLISNSGKLVNTITAHRFNTVLRRTADCVEIACTGRLA